MSKPYYQIALFFNANKVYDREVMAGIGEYIQASRVSWNVFLEDDFIHRELALDPQNLDGIIADFDDPVLVQKLINSDIPVVAVGSSYQDENNYPKNIPYVATDNNAILQFAFEHLQQKGINNFAFYGLPDPGFQHWSTERKMAFERIMAKNNYQPEIYLGHETHSQNWQQAQQELTEWILSLPKHTGIIAVTDARARHLLQTCDLLDIPVPDQLCIIGIDNEELIQAFSRVPLSSVRQGTKNMGYQAAKLLHALIENRPIKHSPFLIPPINVEARTSTDYRSIQDPLIIQALHYIRLNACSGIKVEQVLDYVKASRSNLENRFRIEMGKTIHQVLHDEKMNKAKQLLNDTQIPIQEIAEICGYPSVQYFYFVFKKEFQQTPNEYRAKYNSEALA
ncbi:DNA-binding transcriptional regulator [Gallibacterium salpingitidis]|uniref:XylR family transcriptional regulator n=1 Tax=Gallibacterium salpingitidis TaxID=505341 RepID=A0A1A7P0R3_9PAST|nr:DNA-binding transcriptional regulator [Gallibacterium salpingitidis]OBW95415.1 XylR family transcriptional regulator [Gallibacterium salpingitidis]WKS99078.1 DNA-binding transcriptional regulator [Gallibacterium salpingitidis]